MLLLKVKGGENDMNREFEDLLIEHCSPTLAGIKSANLFCYKESPNEDICETAALWDKNLKQCGIHLTVMKRFRYTSHCLIYVYREKSLMHDLDNPGVKEFLYENGYKHCKSIHDYLLVLSERLNENNSFPHEIGLFLGYPLNDVIGFIKYKGKNYCLSGFWKVYENPQEALKCFQLYKICTIWYKKMFQSGMSIVQLAVAA